MTDLAEIQKQHGVRHICQDGRVYDAERKCDAIQLADEVERLRGFRDLNHGLHFQCEEHGKRNARLQNENARLREALEKIHTAQDKANHDWPYEHPAKVPGGKVIELLFEAIDDSRAALPTPETEVSDG